MFVLLGAHFRESRHIRVTMVRAIANPSYILMVPTHSVCERVPDYSDSDKQHGSSARKIGCRRSVVDGVLSTYTDGVYILGDTAVGKTAICHVAGGEANSFPKTYNCVSVLHSTRDVWKPSSTWSNLSLMSVVVNEALRSFRLTVQEWSSMTLYPIEFLFTCSTAIIID